MALLHQCLEGGQVGFPEVAGGKVLHVELMAVPLRSAMNGEVLGTGQRLHVFPAANIVAREEVVGIALLQAAHNGQSHLCREERVFAVGLLSASPARVAEDVDVRCPERQPLIALHLPCPLRHHVFGTCLIAGDAEGPAHQRIVPRRSHAHGDGEHRCRAVAGNAMQRFVPPLEGRDAQPRDGWRDVHHDFRLLFQRESLAEVASTFFARERRILIRQLLLREGPNAPCEQADQECEFGFHRRRVQLWCQNYKKNSS